MTAEGDLTKVAPPTELSPHERLVIFEHIRTRLNDHRDKTTSYARTERDLRGKSSDQKNQEVQDAQTREIDKWATELLRNIWAACQEPNGGTPANLIENFLLVFIAVARASENCPPLTPGGTSDPRVPLASTSGPDPDRGLAPAPLIPAPDQAQLDRLLNTVLFLHLTSTKGYHAHTRVFLCALGSLDEDVIAATLKNPERAVLEAEAKTQDAKESHARQHRTLRRVGIGLAAVGGGVLVGVTGGLAAPLVGSGVVTALGWLGVGGTAAATLAGGLAGSSVVCGALFGAYGSRKSAQMVGRYTKEVHDLSIVPVHEPTETLAVRLCVSGWLDTPEDVTEPWKVFSGEDTFALQWVSRVLDHSLCALIPNCAGTHTQEVDALMKLSKALKTLIKSQTMQFVKGQVMQQTVFAALMSALSPAAWINIGHIIGMLRPCSVRIRIRFN